MNQENEKSEAKVNEVCEERELMFEDGGHIRNKRVINPFKVYKNINTCEYVEMFIKKDNEGKDIYAYFDYDDLDKIVYKSKENNERYSWSISNGYCQSDIGGQKIAMHKLITDNDFLIKFIDGNKLNNMRVNLKYYKKIKNLDQKPFNKKEYEVFQEPDGLYVRYFMFRMENGKKVRDEYIFDYDPRILNHTWFINGPEDKSQGGYAVSHIKGENKYMHRIIMGAKGTNDREKGFGKRSVDHKNNNRLNNRRSNLYFATPEEQRSNSIGSKEGTKRRRPVSARELPYGFKQTDMPKYIYYSWEKQTNDLGYRDLFRIEKHPAQINKLVYNGKALDSKSWSTSKSMTLKNGKNHKDLLLEKLSAAKKTLADFDKLYDDFKKSAKA